MGSRGVKDGLLVRWSKREGSLLYSYDGGGKPTGGMLAGVFEQTPMHFHYGTLFGDRYHSAMEPSRPEYARTLVQDLDARGYDLTTLRFSIRRKTAPGFDDGKGER